MNENAKKAHELICELAKYKVGDIVYKACNANKCCHNDKFSPIIEAYSVSPMIDIDYSPDNNLDFRYYTRFGRCIGREEHLFLTLQEVIDNEIALYKKQIEECQKASPDPNCEYVEYTSEQAIDSLNKCIEKWQNVNNPVINYIDFIGE